MLGSLIYFFSISLIIGVRIKLIRRFYYHSKYITEDMKHWCLYFYMRGEKKFLGPLFIFLNFIRQSVRDKEYPLVYYEPNFLPVCSLSKPFQSERYKSCTPFRIQARFLRTDKNHGELHFHHLEILQILDALIFPYCLSIASEDWRPTDPRRWVCVFYSSSCLSC